MHVCCYVFIFSFCFWTALTGQFMCDQMTKKNHHTSKRKHNGKWNEEDDVSYVKGVLLFHFDWSQQHQLESHHCDLKFNNSVFLFVRCFVCAILHESSHIIIVICGSKNFMPSFFHRIKNNLHVDWLVLSDHVIYDLLCFRFSPGFSPMNKSTTVRSSSSITDMSGW